MGNKKNNDNLANILAPGSSVQIDLEAPHPYYVYLLNDDYTPMEFVIELLIGQFGFNEIEATRIMLQVHHKGRGICGKFTKEIAEIKVLNVIQFARSNEYPLQCSMEKV